MEFLQAFFAKFCKRCKFSNNEYRYFKARAQLASELDIKRILQSLRLMRAFIKFKTTREERQLFRMQAMDNVIILEKAEDVTKLEDLQNRSLKELFKYQGISSDFDFDYQKIILQKISQDLTNKKMKLFQGLFPVVHNNP